MKHGFGNVFSLKYYFRKIVYLFVFTGFSCVFAGSYDDFFVAINQDDAKRMAALLQRGFDPNTVDPSGTPGLFLAVKAASVNVAEVLIAWPQTKLDVRNSADETPLMLAALSGNLTLCKLLVQKDADVNKTGWTPLHYAATNAHVEIMDLLLQNHAYIDAESPNGTTPLMMAAEYGNAVAVKFLLDAGADPTLKNIQGQTATDFANRADRADSASHIAAQIRARQPKAAW